MLCVPEIEECIDFAKSIGAAFIREIPIKPSFNSRYFMCHDNCSYNPVTGYFFAKDAHNILHAFKHSVLKINDDQLIDNTPVLDSRQYNIFCWGDNINFNNEHLSYIDNSAYINMEKQEVELMYYVYGLIDPRNNQVFYIGKGKDNRCLQHFTESALSVEGNTRKTAKIKKLKSLGYTPMIQFYAQNIEDENLAYSIESQLIKKYGRIGYDKDGILTNKTIDNKPPNHKGKTYEEIYGAKEGLLQKQKRHQLQIEAGGWFKGHKHSDETKEKLKAANNKRKTDGTLLTEEAILEIGRNFCNYFDNKISLSKWKWWSVQNNIPTNILRSFRFENKHLFDIFIEKFNAKKVRDSLLWFHNPHTHATWRCFDWELKHGSPPDGYIRGRGRIIIKKR